VSTAWIVAAGVLTALVVALTAILVRVMEAQRVLEQTVARQQSSITSLRRRLDQGGVPQSTGMDRVAAQPWAPASVVVMLEPDRPDDQALVDDLRTTGSPSVAVPVALYAPDDESGRDLVADLGTDVSFFYRDAPLSEGFPSVVVLDADGAVLTTGSPSAVADLEAMVAKRPAAHVH
jgi:hypothetical protein